MFGILRPCGNRLGEELRAARTAHLCGLCLALRDEHGHLARLVTNYDALVVSALVEAQADSRSDAHPDAAGRRTAGPCALRGMRTASVATGDGARLAASVSLLLASATLTDHVTDGDVRGPVRVRATRAIASHWARAGAGTGTALALDTAALLATADDQRRAEASPTDLLGVTAPTEVSTALAFAHSAVLAGRPLNEAPLAEAGRLFGRLAHLLDAVQDLHEDHALGRWNPILALRLSPADVHTQCRDALLGIRLALADATFTDGRLVHALLVHELDAAATRTFTAAGCATVTRAGDPPPPSTPGAPTTGPGDIGWEAPPAPPERRGTGLGGCLGWLVACGTCQVCCADEWTNRYTGAPHEGLCRKDGCCDACDCCGGGCDCACDSCCDGCDCSC